MAGRHQPQYTRYSSSNQTYSNGGNNNSNLNIPYQAQNNQQYSNQQAPYGNTPSMTSPYSTSSSPGYHSPNVHHHNRNNVSMLPLKKYTLQPPPRILPLSKTMSSLGYPGMFPQRPGQDEDVLTESNIRQGFIDRPIVSNEHTCAHDIVYGKLQDDQRLLGELSSFMVDVLQRQSRAGNITGTPAFKPPIRTTLTDSKREQWMQDLASGVVPLRKLARNVPHGFKGEKLLETLAAKHVPFLRATWYIKVVGLSEMSQRSAGNAATTMGPHPVQWTAIVTSHLRKQLIELIPTNNNSSTASNHVQQSNTQGRARGYNASNHHDNNLPKPWATPENRAKFEQKWSYSVRLARWQYFEGLLDQRTFLKWTLDALAGSGSFEVMWLVLIGIIQDYIDEYKRNRTLTKILIETLIKSYSALSHYASPLTQNNPLGHNVHQGLQRDIENTLQAMFLSTPDMFFVPKLYHQYHNLFELILGEEGSRQTSVSKGLPDICRVMKEYWSMMKARNEVFCGTLEENEMNTIDVNLNIVNEKPTLEKTDSLPNSHEGVQEERVVHVLDSIARNVDSVTGLLLDMDGSSWMDVRGHTARSAAKAIFGTSKLHLQSIARLVNVMCKWAMSESKYGAWKAYLVASILLSWRDGEKASSDNKPLLQDALIKLLDDQTTSPKNNNNEEITTSQETTEEKENQRIACLFDVLIRLHLFSYQKYLLRLIARGDLEPKRRSVKHIQQCLQYLASFPLPSPAPAYLINQRRAALYLTKDNNESKAEIELLNNLKRLTRLAIIGFDDGRSDCLFGVDAPDMTHSVSTDTKKYYEASFTDEMKATFLDCMSSATRYSILNFTSNWLLNEVKGFVVKSIQIGEDNWRVMTSPGSCLLNTGQFVTIIRIMDFANDYISIIETALWVLEKSNDPTLYPYIIDTFRKYSNYWKLTGNGAKIASAVWSKHNSLSSRGNRERCIMMYMVQLVQEGHLIDDSMRVQLQQDLKFKSKIRGRYSSISIRDELLHLAKDPTPASIQLVSESLSVPSQNATSWIVVVLENAGQVLKDEAKTKNIKEEAMNRQALSPLSQGFFDFHRITRAFSSVLKNVADQTILTGQSDEAVIQWLCANEIVFQDMNEECSWVPLFISTLVACNTISLDTVIKEFALPWFEQVECDSRRHNGAEEEKFNIFCQNLITLIRLLIIQTNNQPKTEAESASLPWQLRTEEFYRLEVQRQSQLASSLDKTEPVFGLMERLVMIATNLPLSSNLLQDLVMLRADLLQIGWFRQSCLRDLNGVYQRFAAREAEATMEKRIKKKMLNIVDELIGGNNLSSERQGIVQDTTPDFVDKLHRVFLNISQWNEAQCRVQVNLLLDNISLSEGNSQNPNNPHILGDDSMDVIPTESISVPNKDLQSFVYFFYDIVLSDSIEENDPNKTRRRFQFFKKLIHELREPVLLELLNHGTRLLEGDPNQPFPNNVMLNQVTEPDLSFDSAKFAYRSQSFLNITQHMLAENVWTNDKKIDLVKRVFQQISRFKIDIPIYKVMQEADACHSDATCALQLTKNNVDRAIALLLTEGLPDNIEHVASEKKLSLRDIRISLLIRLRLVVPFASLIWEHPKEDECNILEWIKILVPLLGSPVVHGNGSQERFFEFALDFVSLLLDEVPKELKKASLNLLGLMHNELTSVPTIFHSRVKRIMPFLTHNVYLANTHLASSILSLSPTNDLLRQQQHLESCLEQSKPWEWLEDYISEPPYDNDTPINLALFDTKKSKRTDSTYVKWFKFGFQEGQLPTNNNGDHIYTSQKTGSDKKRERALNCTADESDSMYVASDTEHDQKKRKVEMEDGELP